ncbi:hypothetical protein TBLA_0B01070 [Henningerozyma blattae CBS 6284]|uniref:Centractin n=1 Tax=Henningerozyma blattae (strain ATCC 34711 / CBS 6284 / DSM 70876 / NBRC 10599 / NRRL Y-10934 / UCD 77-7) TaxID=1071380 RepID=I2GXU8_HENB6|nr:hypothetical protein TBLA_0B01070 [Tetrapisispora blattae CBS 6284]CCH58950.1 hypothetical protein TBLA_0B01070 [Tetrapisispora blattae CBS 6284]
MEHINDEILYNQPIVLDNGSALLKAGFGGDDKPKCFEYSLIGTPKYDKVMVGGVEKGKFVGNLAQEYRGLLKLRYPMDHGIIENWEHMETVWDHIFKDCLKVSNLGEHPLVVTEAPLNPKPNREKMCETLFESFNIPALYIANPAVLSLYASGRTTGCVVEAGDGYCSSVPIYEGFALTPSIRRIDIGGRDITKHLQLQLRKSTGMWLYSSSEQEIVRLIKENGCYICSNHKKEEEKFLLDQEKKSISFKLPDGKNLVIGPGRFRAPEILFNPLLIGSEDSSLPDMIMQSISKVDIDLRSKLLNNITLSGGSTMFQGFCDRLITELDFSVDKTTKVRILAPPERKYSAFIGGSILANLSTFRNMWVTKDQWEGDNRIIENKFM